MLFSFSTFTPIWSGWQVDCKTFTIEINFCVGKKSWLPLYSNDHSDDLNYSTEVPKRNLAVSEEWLHFFLSCLLFCWFFRLTGSSLELGPTQKENCFIGFFPPPSFFFFLFFNFSVVFLLFLGSWLRKSFLHFGDLFNLILVFFCMLSVLYINL